MCNQLNTVEWSKHPAVVLEPEPVPPKAANIRDCSITTDSVVATATVTTDGTMRRIVVQWGDGKINTLRYRPGIEAAIGQQNQLPSGTYKFSHAYEAPEDRKTFDQVVVIKVEDQSGGIDFCINKITLTPRYRVTNYRTRLNLESHCDSRFEATSEFDIWLLVDQELVNLWRWEPEESVLPGTPFVLEGSLVSRELTVADGYVLVQLELTERDPVFDDYLYSVSMNLSANDESLSISYITEGDGCKVRYSYDKEVTLIVPLPSYGHTVVLAANP